MQIDALAERVGRAVRWRPFLLGAVYKQVEQSPLDHPPKRDYVNAAKVAPHRLVATAAKKIA